MSNLPHQQRQQRLLRSGQLAAACCNHKLLPFLHMIKHQTCSPCESRPPASSLSEALLTIAHENCTTHVTCFLRPPLHLDLRSFPASAALTSCAAGCSFCHIAGGTACGRHFS